MTAFLAAPQAPAGYSGTPLAKKLGIGPGTRVLLVQPPPDYAQWLAPLPPGVVFVSQLSQDTDLVHWFGDQAAALALALAGLRHTIRPNAALWVSWPKKASRVPTDITEDLIRQQALPLGWVDTKVCAVSAVWSGLKLVIRKALRP